MNHSIVGTPPNYSKLYWDYRARLAYISTTIFSLHFVFPITFGFNDIINDLQLNYLPTKGYNSVEQIVLLTELGTSSSLHIWLGLIQQNSKINL